MPQSMKAEPRFLTAEGPEIFTGNELLLKGALEATGGVHLLGGYPGSPVAGFFDALALVKELLAEKGIRAVINNNEALAAAMLNGSQTVGARAMIVVKSVGAHVASDALALGNLAGAHPDGGGVVVYGDDPWSDSTQVPADSRFISRHLFIPVVEPADPQEVKDFVDLALRLSRGSGLLAGYVLTTNLADGGGSVQCRSNQFPTVNTRQRVLLETAAIDVNKRVLLPPKTVWQEATLPGRHGRAVELARQLGLNRILYGSGRRKPLGFASSGLAHGYLVQALLEVGLLGEFPILKFGMSYPLDAELVAELAGACRRIVVVEERRGFLEGQIGEALIQLRQEGRLGEPVELWGKRFPGGREGFPEIRGLHPSIVIERLSALLEGLGREAVAIPPAAAEAFERETATMQATSEVHSSLSSLPARLPTFCPGCPHRDTSSLCLEIKKRFLDEQYMARRHGRGAVDLIFHGDTGCYTMLMYPPNTALMHDYSGMGLGGGTGSGTAPFVLNKEVVFMGDSTFFHSGQIAVSNAVKLGQDITFIILDNSTTAMTGHQPTPGVGYDVVGNPTAVQDIEEVVRGMAGDSQALVVRADPEKRKAYGELLEETFLAEGVKVIIATKECGITRMRRKRREERAISRRLGFLPAWEHMNVNLEVCRACLACAEQTGCPGLKRVATDYGWKMDTDTTWCVNDGACERVRACSAFEQVTIKRKRPPRSRVPELGLEEIPEPQRRPSASVNGASPGWRCCLVGVGGMGIGLATQILVRAGHKEGYPVLFVDKKGLAIRNGGVVSQVVYNPARQPVTALIPFGKADLLMGIDALEAARALDPRGRTRVASPRYTAAVINTDKVPTIRALTGQEDFDVDALEQVIRANTRPDDYLARNISRICEKYLGSKLYANIMMLGFAFQKGLIPVSMHSMAWAVKDTIRADFRKNLYAFNMGRKLVVQPDLFQGAPRRTGWRETLEENCRNTIRRYRRGHRLAEQIRQLVSQAVEALTGLDEADRRAFVVRAYDCMRWGGIDYARRYAAAVTGLHAKDDPDRGYAATRAALYNLAEAMLIKDAVYLAELITSPEKRARDREKYNVNPANGDRIAYRHLLHPAVKLGLRRFALDLAVRPWMLAALKRMKWLRKLPGWRAEQRRFLAAYEARAADFDYAGPEDYARRLAGLSSPQCMVCLNPRCREEGCPLEGPIPEWLGAAYRGQWRQAYELLAASNNFPEVTSQICPAPCQAACKQGQSGHAVQIRELERQIVERAFREDWLAPRRPERKTGKSVAIVGSGPAGLAAAQQLARAGHEVTVFEKEDRPGGLLRYGVPEERLDKRMLDRRLEQLSAEGVAFRTGTEVGRDVQAAALRERFDAVLLTAGAARPRDLDVPGRQQAGVVFALDYLRQAGGGATSAKGKAVAVIGGGDTGNDCVEAALAEGAVKVYQLEILPNGQGGCGGSVPAGAEQPAGRLSRDGLERRWSVATKRFGGDGGRITELEGVEVQWLHSDHGAVVRELPGSEFRIPVDLALLALGYDAVLDPQLAEQFVLDTDPQGRVLTRDYATSVAGVFAAGDLVSGASYAAEAIRSGREAAERIDNYLAPSHERVTVVRGG